MTSILTSLRLGVSRQGPGRMSAFALSDPPRPLWHNYLSCHPFSSGHIFGGLICCIGIGYISQWPCHIPLGPSPWTYEKKCRKGSIYHNGLVDFSWMSSTFHFFGLHMVLCSSSQVPTRWFAITVSHSPVPSSQTSALVHWASWAAWGQYLNRNFLIVGVCTSSTTRQKWLVSLLEVLTRLCQWGSGWGRPIIRLFRVSITSRICLEPWSISWDWSVGISECLIALVWVQLYHKPSWKMSTKNHLCKGWIHVNPRHHKSNIVQGKFQGYDWWIFMNIQLIILSLGIFSSRDKDIP